MSTATSAPPLAFTQDDLDRAFSEWRCNCGPSALAACLGITLDAVRPLLGVFPGYLSPTGMRTAIAASGHRAETRWEPTPPARPLLDPEPHGFPPSGVVRIQFGGPWLKPGVHPGAAYQRTHWVASRHHLRMLWVFDVNGGWVPAREWEREIMPLLTAAVKRSDGTWFPTHRWNLVRA